MRHTSRHHNHFNSQATTNSAAVLASGPIVLPDGSLEFDSNDDGLTDIWATAEQYSVFGFEPGGGVSGYHIGKYADVWIDRDFDGLSDMFIGSGYPVDGFPERVALFGFSSLEEVDLNADAVADVWRTSAVTTSVRIDGKWHVREVTAAVQTEDTDFDGEVDLWTYGGFDKGAFHSIDGNNDGVFDTWVFEDKVVEHDTDQDGTPDFRTSSGGLMAFDQTGDGVADLTYYNGAKTETLTEAGWTVVSQDEMTFDLEQHVPNDWFYLSGWLT